MIAQDRRSGLGTALLSGLTGGLGFFVARGPAVLLHPRVDTTRYWGDLLFVRSYNPSFYQLAPPFPRDLAFALLVCALSLVILGNRRDDLRLIALGGAAVGVAGLSNPDSFLVGAGALVLLCIFPAGMRRRRLIPALLLPLAGMYALWFVPQMLSYVHFGGYVNLTKVTPVVLPAWAIVASWGVITPLAAIGFVIWAPRARHDPGARLLLLVAVSAGALVGAVSVASHLVGHAFMALDRAHRYWPLLGFALAVYAGLGLGELVSRLRPRAAAVAAALLAVLLALPSPVLASAAAPAKAPPWGSYKMALGGDPNALLNLVAEDPGRCVVAAPRRVARQIWAYSGYRLLMFQVSVPHPGNPARIRWPGIYRRTIPIHVREHVTHVLTHGLTTPRDWLRLAHRYGIDIVVAPDYAVHPGKGFPPGGRRASNLPFTVFRLDGCGS